MCLCQEVRREGAACRELEHATTTPSTYMCRLGRETGEVVRVGRDWERGERGEMRD
jgi:hypothetical protein